MDETTYQDLMEREAVKQQERILSDYESQYARYRGYDE